MHQVTRRTCKVLLVKNLLIIHLKGKYICLSLSVVHTQKNPLLDNQIVLENSLMLCQEKFKNSRRQTHAWSIGIYRNSGISVLTRQILCSSKFESHSCWRILVFYMQECVLWVSREVKRHRSLKEVEIQMNRPRVSLSCQQNYQRSSKIKPVVSAWLSSPEYSAYQVAWWSLRRLKKMDIEVSLATNSLCWFGPCIVKYLVPFLVSLRKFSSSDSITWLHCAEPC